MLVDKNDKVDLGSWLLGLIMCLLFVGPLHSQTTLTRADPMREIRFDRVVTFGDQDGPGFLGEPGAVVHRGNSEWVVTDQMNPAEIKFFSEDGAWVRTIGREGSGPGEFWAYPVSVDR